MMSYSPEAGLRTSLDTLPEPQRNRLLRRADWRFLRPGSRPAKSVCFGGGRLAETVAAISDQVIEPGRAAPGECDLAVASDPEGPTLRAAWSALRAGGTYYGEYHRPWAGGAPGRRWQLQAAGFTDVACFWPWPLPDRASPLFWLPVEAPQALQYFLATRPRAASVWLRARGRLLQSVWRFGVRSRFLFPLCVVARRPAADRSGADDDLLDAIRSNWTSWGLGTMPDHLAWLLLTGGRSSINKVTGLVFANADPRPQLIVKLPRLPESAAALAREATNLRTVEAARPNGAPGVPRVVFFRDSAGQVTLGETVLSGRPIFTVLQRSNFRQWALAATDWLADLAGHGPARPRAEWWQRLVEPALDDFERSFGSIADNGRLAETRAILATLGDLPLVIEQRDFSPWNVLIGQAGELAVLDWESAEPSGLPALDLTYFLTYLAFFLDGAMETSRFAESYQSALDSTTFTGGILTECQRRYATRVGIDPAALRPLRLLTWLIHSRSEYRQFMAEAARQPSPTALRGGVFFRLWAEELRLGQGAAAGLAVREAM